MSRLILVRHGETDHAGTYCGQIDPDLNMNGEKQAEEIARRLSSMTIERIYSSDLRRAWRTAQAIARCSGAPHSVSASLREMAFGEWEGLRWSEIEGRSPEEAGLWMKQYPNRPAPGGESIGSFSARVLRAMRRIRARARGTVCVVSHGGVIRLALTRLFNMDEDRAWALTREYGGMIELGGDDEHCNQTRR